MFQDFEIELVQTITFMAFYRTQRCVVVVGLVVHVIHLYR